MSSRHANGHAGPSDARPLAQPTNTTTPRKLREKVADDMAEDTRAPLTVKEMLIDLGGKFDVLNTELRYDRAASADAIVRVYRELDAASTAREAMKVDIREVRDRKTVSPMTLWIVVAGFLTLVIGAAGVVVSAVKV